MPGVLGQVAIPVTLVASAGFCFSIASRMFALICWACCSNASKSFLGPEPAPAFWVPPLWAPGVLPAAFELVAVAFVGAGVGRVGDDWAPGEDEGDFEATWGTDADEGLFVAVPVAALGCAGDWPGGLFVAAGTVTVDGLEPKNEATAARDIACRRLHSPGLR